MMEQERPGAERPEEPDAQDEARVEAGAELEQDGLEDVPPGPPQSEPQAEEPLVLQAAEADADAAYDGRANLYPEYAFDEVYDRPREMNLLAPLLVLATFLVVGGLGFMAWKKIPLPNVDVAQIARVFTQPAQAKAPAAEPAIVAPAAYVASPPAAFVNAADRAELEAARAALRELGIEAPTVADGVRLLAKRAAPATMIAANLPVAPATASAKPAALASPIGCAIDGADVLGVVYFESGSINLDAVDIAALIGALADGRVKPGQTIDIVGFADGEAVQESCAQATTINGVLACSRAQNVAAELSRMAPTVTVAASSTAQTENTKPRRCGRRAEVRLRSV